MKQTSDIRKLKEKLSSFIGKKYSIWRTKNELKTAPAKKDKVLSQITQIMYSYNLTVDLETERYTLFTGTGMERTVEEYKKHQRYDEIKAFQNSIIHPTYILRFNELTDLESARNNRTENGLKGSLEYPVLYPGDTEYEWHEINVFIETEEDGTRIANILGRDITEIHKAQERKENELQAAATKNQILSELTKMLYSYNLTLNLKTGKYSMIIGTGMTQFMDIFNETDDYETAYNKKISYLDPRHVSQFANLASLESLRSRTNANGFIGYLEYCAITEYGDEWHEINVFISSDETGERVANILGRDITEAHERQEQRENQQKAAMARDQLLSGVTKMLYGYNLTVNLETWKYSLITGTGMDDFVDVMRDTDDYVLLHAKLLNFVFSEDKQKVDQLVGIEALQRMENTTGLAGTLSYRSNVSGTTKWYEVNLFMGTNEDGIPEANILGRDITEIHEAQERRENELRAVAAKDQILSDITKTLYSYNLTLNLGSGKYSLIVGTGMKEFVKIFESTDDYETAYRQKIQYVTDDYTETFSEFSSLDKLRERRSETGYIGNLEYSVKTRKGIEWHEINIFIGSDENGESIANILGRDVTEAHDKADTKAQLEIANASNAAKSAFLFNMSHDIRTPMNAIMGFTELLEKHLDDKELAKSYIKKIKVSNEFLLSLINNVLEMARIESGKANLNETGLNVYSFNESLYELFDSQMSEKGIDFKITTHVEHTDVICDETKLREILLNILSNSLKYTPAGGRVTMELNEISSDRPGYGIYRTVIEDTGVGMSMEYLPHLFEEFTRERTSTESKINGTGLGMSIVKKLVDLMQGTIEVESVVGEGTKITVTLPHKIAENKDSVEPVKIKPETEADFFKGKRILLAEDNELNAEIAITILREAGFEVEHAADGLICVNMMDKNDAGYYDMILMDIQMPNMDGYKATKTIRKFSDEKKAGIIIVAMTANAFEEDKKAAYEAGMNGHIAKPIEIDKLLSTFEDILKTVKN
ncbi:MAG: hybrid sensor histidine kinase/response regulator [Lachnospiraceae bacterium]